MYIRQKTRKNSSGNCYAYAYLVSSKYRKKHPKQKVIAYLGRVYTYNKQKNTPPITIKEDKTDKLDFNSLSLLILKKFLVLSGLKEKDIQTKDGITIDLLKRTIRKNNIKVTISLNKGHLNDFTLSQFLDFKTPNKSDFRIGKELATKMLNIGIEPEKELFLMLFNKLRKKYGTNQQ